MTFRHWISPNMRIFLDPPAAMLTTVLVALVLELALRDVLPVTYNRLETLKTMPGRRDRRIGAMLLRFRSTVSPSRRPKKCTMHAYFDNEVFVACPSQLALLTLQRHSAACDSITTYWGHEGVNGRGCATAYGLQIQHAHVQHLGQDRERTLAASQRR